MATVSTGNSYLDTSASDVTLAGGTINTDDIGMAINSLTLSDNSTINLGSNETFTIGDSSALAWTAGKTLIINNWAGSLDGPSTGSEILVTAGFFSDAQLAQIQFDGFAKGAAIVGGELVPTILAIPEASTYLGITGLLLLAICHRSILKSFKS